LFCGIGGFRIAFERAGCDCVFSSDWNEMAQITYEANFHERPHGDIYSVADNAIPPHDILCAGFPCQPLSIAGVSKKLSLGKKHGFEDKEQGNLFFRPVFYSSRYSSGGSTSKFLGECGVSLGRLQNVLANNGPS
jgi:DNA (cytosine-5)-methyltransferase 1